MPQAQLLSRVSASQVVLQQLAKALTTLSAAASKTIGYSTSQWKPVSTDLKTYQAALSGFSNGEPTALLSSYGQTLRANSPPFSAGLAQLGAQGQYNKPPSFDLVSGQINQLIHLGLQPSELNMVYAVKESYVRS
jgi:hypothetical protein